MSCSLLHLDAARINGESLYKSAQEVLSARDKLEALSGVKLPRMRGYEGESEASFIELHRLFETAMTEEELNKGVVTFSNGWETPLPRRSRLRSKIMDPRFDLYTQAMAVMNKMHVEDWKVPTAKDVRIPTEEKHVKEVTYGFIEHVKVPISDENQADVEGFTKFSSSTLAALSPKPIRADLCGKWKPGEKQVGDH